jgi:hypothetical protein
LLFTPATPLADAVPTIFAFPNEYSVGIRRCLISHVVPAAQHCVSPPGTEVIGGTSGLSAAADMRRWAASYPFRGNALMLSVGLLYCDRLSIR